MVDAGRQAVSQGMIAKTCCTSLIDSLKFLTLSNLLICSSRRPFFESGIKKQYKLRRKHDASNELQGSFFLLCLQPFRYFVSAEEVWKKVQSTMFGPAIRLLTALSVREYHRLQRLLKNRSEFIRNNNCMMKAWKGSHIIAPHEKEKRSGVCLTVL